MPALAVISHEQLFDTLHYPFVGKNLPIVWLGPAGGFLPLCGHATLATSLVLFAQFPDLQTISFSARSGQRILAFRTEIGACIVLPALLQPLALSVDSQNKLTGILTRACNLEASDVVYMGESCTVRNTVPNPALPTLTESM